jgi:ABC-2 type transport system permease protein
LCAQLKVRLALAACLISPFAFAAAMRLQSSLPTDTLFGRWVTDSGFAVPLVVLGFAALWAFPVLASIVAGDVFSAEDRYGTWSTVLTRSRSRAEVFAGKVLAALAFSTAGVAVMAISSVAAGALIVGRQPLVSLSGILLPPGQATASVVLAWMSVLLPVFGFTALAVLVSIVTRSSAAGIGLPVVAALTMQLFAFVDSPDGPQLLITSAFEAWHGFLTEPLYFRPLVYGTTVSLLYTVACLSIVPSALRRDIGDDEKAPTDSSRRLPRGLFLAGLRNESHYLDPNRTRARTTFANLVELPGVADGAAADDRAGLRRDGDLPQAGGQTRRGSGEWSCTLVWQGLGSPDAA